MTHSRGATSRGTADRSIRTGDRHLEGVEGLDLPEVLRYAEEKGVRLRLWMHGQAVKAQIDGISDV